MTRRAWPADRRHGRVVGVGGEAHPGLLRDGNNRLEEVGQVGPQLLSRHRRDGPGRSVRVIGEIPDLAVGNRRLLRPGRGREPNRLRPAPGERPNHMPPDPGDAEVVAQHGDTGLAHPPHDRLDVLELLGLLRAIEENVVPVGRIEVFDRSQGQTLGLDGLAQVAQLLDRPQLAPIVAEAPAVAGALGGGDARPLAEIVDPVSDDVGRPRLLREAEIVRRQHLPIESQTELHGAPPCHVRSHAVVARVVAWIGRGRQRPDTAPSRWPPRCGRGRRPTTPPSS